MNTRRTIAIVYGSLAWFLLTSCAAPPGVGPLWLTCSPPAPHVATDTMRASQLTLSSPAGHVLIVPAGAAAQGTVFTLRTLPTPMPRVIAHSSAPLTGTVSLELSHRDCSPGGVPDNYQIWRQAQAGSRWERVGGQANPRTGRIAVGLQSFSTYSLAAN